MQPQAICACKELSLPLVRAGEVGAERLSVKMGEM
jgi:hypothetical protein